MINRVVDAAAVAAGRWRWRKARTLTDLANLQADRIARDLAGLTDDDLGPKRSMYSTLVALGRAGVVVADWRLGTSTYPDGYRSHLRMFTDESHTAAALFSGDIDGGPALPPLADAGIAPMKATDPQQVYHLLNKIHTGMLARSAYLQGYPVTTSLETRACVTGFADDETKDWLDELLHAAGRAPGATKYKLASVFETYGPGCIEYDRSGGDDNYRNLGRCWVERIDGVETARIGAQMTAKQVYQTFPTGPSLQRELRKAWQITICAPTWGCGCMFADLLPLLVRHRRPAATAV